MKSENSRPYDPQEGRANLGPNDVTESFLEAFERIQVAECDEMSSDLGRARMLLKEASAQLVKSFNQLTADTLSQQQRVEGLLADMSGAVREDGTEGLNIAAFVGQTASVLQNFAEVLVHFSKQSVTISYKIDDMVEHMDAIFELVSQVDSMAEETNILAINAALEAARAGEAGKGFKVVASEVRMLSRDTKKLNEAIGGQVDAAREVIDDVRTAAREIASQDMSMALAAKGGVDDMLDRLQGMEEQIGRTLDEVAEFTVRVRESADDAVRSMQFEDMVSQLLQHLENKMAQMRSMVRRARETADQAPGAGYGSKLIESLTDFAKEEQPPRAVEQESMEAGDIELF